MRYHRSVVLQFICESYLECKSIVQLRAKATVVPTIRRHAFITRRTVTKNKFNREGKDLVYIP